MKLFQRISLISLLLILISGCSNREDENFIVLNREPCLEPDYSGITIPVNIAPLNFKIKEQGYLRVRAISSNGFSSDLRSKRGIVSFPIRIWNKLIRGEVGGKIKIEIISTDKGGKDSRFEPVYFNIADSADQYLCYRLLYPGYETYYDIKIIQRDISGFREKSVIENQVINHNCINCHTFSNNSPDRFMIHVRGDNGGTYFIDGENITREDFKTDQLPAGATYPAWHRGGRYISFSSNTIRQSFHSAPDKNIEVTDLSSYLILYDTKKNIVTRIPEADTAKYMDTFPEWSPDGKFLYFCRAAQYKDGDDFKTIHYNLVRKSFSEESGSFGNTETVFDAATINKSVSFPRISPDGNYLVFTLHDYGNFSIWHKEADLYLYDIRNKTTVKMDINSNETESYHSWSSNSKWLVFSSKRDDGLTARPYFAYIGSPDHQGKPFVLPQKDPSKYNRMVLTFNRPEFVTGEIKIGPRDIAREARKIAQKPVWK